MRKAIVGGLLAVLIAAGLAGWVLWWRGHQTPEPPETAEQRQYRMFLETTLSGYSGKLHAEPWNAYVPCYREGALQVHAGLVGFRAPSGAREEGPEIALAPVPAPVPPRARSSLRDGRQHYGHRVWGPLRIRIRRFGYRS